jgi:dipeptidyl aminopeptidase/acylaminoacyl peptidase
MLRSLLRAPAIAIALASTLVQAQSSRGRPLAVEDYYRVKSVGAPSLSPDAKWVAFTVSARVEETNGNTAEVWIVPSDGSAAARRVSPEGVNSNSFTWTNEADLVYPTGNGAFSVFKAATNESAATTAPPDGGGRGAGGRGGRGGGRGGAGRGEAPTMSPDGKWAASVREVRLAPHPTTPLTEFEQRHEARFKGVEFDWMDFHRDDQPFPVQNTKDPEVSPPQEIFMTPAMGEARQITHLGLRPTGVQWLPDNSAVIFSADSTYRDEHSYGRTDIWNLTTAGQLKRLTPNSDYDYNGARLSPNGKWILCTRQLTRDYVIGKKLDHGGAVDVVVIPAGGGAEKILTADWDYLPAAQQWSPDGKYIYFTGGVGGATHLFRVSPEGGAVEQMTKGERDIGGLGFTKDYSKIVYTVGVFEHPSEIYSANIDGSNEKQLTHVHDALTKEVALGKSERLLFKSADGTPIEGWLLFPYGYRANGGPYPMIVASHGGPHAATQYGFNFKNQYFAANGYFVLETNFRSSTGYGEKFLWATWGAWGTKDGQDVMAGIDYAISKYPIDKNHVGSIGHSYGGFMTNWLITQYPDRFAAAASGAGIVNWTSDYGNSDIPVTKEMEFYGAPWEQRARDIMIKQSPLTYANRVKAATLFINGEIDQRVPYSENQQMYVALKKNGVPAKMIQYADQPHGIAGSWNAVHRMLNERRWFDQYLKQPSIKQ